MRFFVFCFLFVSTVLAQKAGVEGCVSNGVTGEPLKKAQVTLFRSGRTSSRPDMPLAALTDSEGRYSFKNLEPGQYHVQAERSGFVRVERRSGTLISIGPGQALQGVDLRLSPQAVIAGRVLDEDGEPLADAPVQALRYSYVYGKRLVPAAGTTTNDLGEYRVHGLAPGRYFVSASYRGHSAILDEGYVPAYFPGTTDPAAAGQLQVAAGEQLAGIDLTLSKMKLVRVSGRVTNAPGEHSGSAITVALIPRGSTPVPYDSRRHGAAPNAQGNFEITGVPPGSYMISATTYQGRAFYSVRQPVEVGDSNVEGIDLAITEGADVRGQVRFEGQGSADPGMLRITLAPREDGAGGPGGAATVEAKGAFTLHNVGSGTYDVNVSGLPEDYYVKSVRLGGKTDILSTGFSISQDTGAPLEITVSAAGGRILGVVLDGNQQPAAAATVALAPGSKTASTDQTGRFTLRGIAPGDYKLFAWEDVEPGAWQDPDFLKPFERSATAVSVDENGREQVQLKLPR